MNKLTDKINNCLPQTQCTLCGYPDCNSYAQALATKTEANIGLCVPGNNTALDKISKILQLSPTKFKQQVKENSTPPSIAKIVAKDCIGCMKCINACPVDAIIGGKKKLHTIINQECTGCKLCIDPCPTECIILLPSKANSTKNLYKAATHRKQRYTLKLQRINRLNQQQKIRHSQAKADSITARKNLITAILNSKKHE